MKWSAEEQETLKKLIQVEGEVSWEKIAREINFRFNKNGRTGRQCRQKYINYIRFNGIQQRVSQWTVQQQNSLLRFYKELGPVWSVIVSNFPRKSENCIKNKFYNNLRRLSRRLQDHQRVYFKFCRSHISYDSMITILQLCTQIFKWKVENNCILNKSSKIFSCKQKILDIAFKNNQQITESQLSQIVSQMKSLNKKLRCLGLFKIKNKKSWSISQKRMEFILAIDDVLEPNNIPSTQVKVEENCQREIIPSAVDVQPQLTSRLIPTFQKPITQTQKINQNQNKVNYYHQVDDKSALQPSNQAYQQNNLSFGHPNTENFKSQISNHFQHPINYNVTTKIQENGQNLQMHYYPPYYPYPDYYAMMGYPYMNPYAGYGYPMYGDYSPPSNAKQEQPDY